MRRVADAFDDDGDDDDDDDDDDDSQHSARNASETARYARNSAYVRCLVRASLQVVRDCGPVISCKAFRDIVGCCKRGI